MAKYRIVRIKGKLDRHRVEKRWFSLFGIEFWRTVSEEWMSLGDAESWVQFEKWHGQNKVTRNTVVKIYD